MYLLDSPCEILELQIVCFGQANVQNVTCDKTELDTLFARSVRFKIKNCNHKSIKLSSEVAKRYFKRFWFKCAGRLLQHLPARNWTSSCHDFTLWCGTSFSCQQQLIISTIARCSFTRGQSGSAATWRSLEPIMIRWELKKRKKKLKERYAKISQFCKELWSSSINGPDCSRLDDP